MEWKNYTDEALITLWHNESKKAELTDDWTKVHEIEEEMIRRGMDPAAEADPSWIG